MNKSSRNMYNKQGVYNMSSTSSMEKQVKTHTKFGGTSDVLLVNYN